jgi:hypothetical protein
MFVDKRSNSPSAGETGPAGELPMPLMPPSCESEEVSFLLLSIVDESEETIETRLVSTLPEVCFGIRHFNSPR